MRAAVLLIALFSLSCMPGEKPASRLVMFVGVDISGSFLNSKHFDDSLNFMAHYLYSHLKGLGGAEVPRELFVASIGGVSPNEPKTFYPIQTFQDQSLDTIREKLKEIFPRSKSNPFTDYNAYFEQVANTVQNKKLILRPVSIVLLSDGFPDVPGAGKNHDYRKIALQNLEKLSRNITVRLLYTSPIVGQNWQSKVPRKRVKIWTQDAEIMKMWNDANIFKPGQGIENQPKFFAWLKDNVDFNVRLKRVD